MVSRFAVPVMISTALHALVFWLGSGTPDRTPPPPTDKMTTVVGPRIPFPPIEIDETPPPADRSEEQTPKGSREIPGPVIEESYRQVTDGEIAFTPMPRPPGPQISDHIPKYAWPGDPDGMEGVTPGAPVIFPPGALDRTPRTRSQTRPDYPNEARVSGLTGEVLVEFVVDESGRVMRPHVVRSTDSRFETAALRAIERWRFEPGKKDGKIVRFRMAVPFVFSLDGS